MLLIKLFAIIKSCFPLPSMTLKVNRHNLHFRGVLGFVGGAGSQKKKLMYNLVMPFKGNIIKTI